MPSLKTADEPSFDPNHCSPKRAANEPDLMAWDSAARLNILARQKDGVVAVRYEASGCRVTLELLNCVGAGTYNFSAYSAHESKYAATQGELFAELPLGAASLSGHVAGTRAVRTDYDLAGMFSTQVMQSYPPSKLRGDCARATHVIDKIYVGGFALAEGEQQSLRAEASVFGASRSRDSRVLTEEGSAEACRAARATGKYEAMCSVPLRIGLVPIGNAAEEAKEACPSTDATEVREKISGDWFLSEATQVATYRLGFTNKVAKWTDAGGAYYEVESYGWQFPNAKFWHFDGKELVLTNLGFEHVYVMTCKNAQEWRGPRGILRRKLGPNQKADNDK